MTFVPSSSFYVTLMSHASTREFPQNRAHHFKNRLPKPIRFVGRGWQVGMVSLSLPTISVVGEPFVNEKDVCFTYDGTRECMSKMTKAMIVGGINVENYEYWVKT